MLRPTDTDADGIGYYRDDVDGKYYYVNPHEQTIERSWYDHPEDDYPQNQRTNQRSGGSSYQNSGHSYGQIMEDGFQKMGSDITNTFHETNRRIGSGILETICFGLLAAFGITYTNEIIKDPGNTANAISKGLRNVLCVVGILAIIAVLCIVTFGYAMFAVDEPSLIGKILLTVFIFCGCYGVLGLIRVMMDKTFFIHFKKRYRVPSDVKPLTMRTYALIEFGSIVVLYEPIKKVIRNIAFERNPNMLFYEEGIKSFAECVGIAALAGILICLVVTFVRKHL